MKLGLTSGDLYIPHYPYNDETNGISIPLTRAWGTLAPSSTLHDVLRQGLLHATGPNTLVWLGSTGAVAAPPPRRPSRTSSLSSSHLRQGRLNIVQHRRTPRLSSATTTTTTARRRRRRVGTRQPRKVTTRRRHQQSRPRRVHVAL